MQRNWDYRRNLLVIFFCGQCATFLLSFVIIGLVVFLLQTNKQTLMKT